MKPSLKRASAREVGPYHVPRDWKVSPIARGVTYVVLLSLVGGCATANIDTLHEASERAPTNAKAQLQYIDERNH